MENMDKVDKIVVDILKQDKESDYMVQGGRAFIAALKPDFLEKLPEDVREHMMSHDFNIIYTGDDFPGFVAKFFTALDGMYSRVSVSDTWREGKRLVKKAMFVKDVDEDRAAEGGRGKRVRAEPFLTISDGSKKTAATYGRLSDACKDDAPFIVGGIRFIGMCEALERFTRMLAPDNRFLRDKGPRVATRLRVLLHAADDKVKGLVRDVDLRSFKAQIDKLRSYTHLRGVGVAFPAGGPDPIFGASGSASAGPAASRASKARISKKQPAPRKLKAALAKSASRASGASPRAVSGRAVSGRASGASPRKTASRRSSGGPLRATASGGVVKSVAREP